MRILGAVLAGGRATRFGSDKALAVVDGERMIDRVVAALARQADDVVVTGRQLAGSTCLPDRPRGGLGPLGGLAAALLHARDRGYEQVLSAPCDVPDLPDVRDILGGGDRYLAGMPVVGLWRAHHAPALLRFLDEDPRRAVRGWADAIGARAVTGPTIANINTPEDVLQRRSSNNSSNVKAE